MNAAEAARFRAVLDTVAAKPIPDLTAALVTLTNVALVAARAMVDLAETLHRMAPVEVGQGFVDQSKGPI